MSKKILLVDDEPVSVKLVQSRLEANNYEVITATDGDIGLEKARTEKPDLILLDVQMPRLNGYTFMHAVKKSSELKSIPIIVLTAQTTMKPIFIYKGAKDYLIKPINVEELLEKITQYLDPA